VEALYLMVVAVHKAQVTLISILEAVT